MLGEIVGYILGAASGILIMAILSGRLDDRAERKNKKSR